MEVLNTVELVDMELNKEVVVELVGTNFHILYNWNFLVAMALVVVVEVEVVAAQVVNDYDCNYSYKTFFDSVFCKQSYILKILFNFC